MSYTRAAAGIPAGGMGKGKASKRRRRVLTLSVSLQHWSREFTMKTQVSVT